jgi:ubiquinone/menaquinone biosynthesis C-methylase UbiE
MESNSIEDSVSQSLECRKELLPYIPQLLEGLWALGGSPEIVAQFLDPLELPPDDTRMVDLGCGKGAMSVILAKRFGFQTLGIDANPAFLQEAEAKARAAGVESLCRFEQGDIREFVKKQHIFDIAVYASLGGILGSFSEIVGHLRRGVRPGGYMIIDDGFLQSGARLDRTGYGHYKNHEKTVLELVKHGDKIVAERILTRMENEAIDAMYLRIIKSNANVLVKKHPELEQAVVGYVKNQEEECEYIEQHLEGAIWMLERSAF